METSSGAPSRERDRFYEKLSVVTLTVAGFYFLFVPTVFPGALGWTALTSQFGEGRILAFAVGFQFFYIATLTRDKYRLRRVTLETLEALNQFVFGSDYRRQRQMVEVLIRGLGTKDASARRKAAEALAKMTGEDFGEDREAWARWWSVHKSRFRARTQPAPPGETSADPGNKDEGGTPR